MPKILELREIDGAVWCRVGVIGEFGNGIALWTPEEQREKYNEGYTDGWNEAQEED